MLPLRMLQIFSVRYFPISAWRRQYTEEEFAKLKTTVRNVTGWPTADAVKVFKNLKINYEVIGTGEVVKYQIPAKGAEIIKNEGKVFLYTGRQPPRIGHPRFPMSPEKPFLPPTSCSPTGDST